MTATADMILERRRSRRKLAFWRIAAIVLFLVTVLALVPWRSALGPDRGGDHVARIQIDGVIVDDSKRTETIRKLAERESVKALIVDIASPGGTVVGSEALYESLRHVAAKKPVVAVVGEIAASGGYIAAIGADHIVTRQNTITGSIGVISQVPNVTGLLDKLGVEVREVKSSPLKAQPSPFTDPSEDAIEALDALIEDSYAWFRDLVAERRGLEGEALARVADGRVFTGRQAQERGLVDAIGAEPEARDWLASTHEVSADLKVRDYDWTDRPLPFPLDMLENAGLDFWRAGVEGLNLSPGPRLMALYTG